MEPIKILKSIDCQLELYEDKVIIRRKQQNAFDIMIFGKVGDSIIPIDSITTIEFLKPDNWSKSGSLKFGVIGGPNLHPYSGIDLNIFSFGDEKQDILDAVFIKDYIENSIVERKSERNNFSTADELIKLKDLLDKGVITQEEFDAQKKKIL